MKNNHSRQTRREFLRTSTLAAASVVVASEASASILFSGVSSRFSNEDVAESDNFRLGVASGDVTSKSAIVWTYYEGFYALKLVVWHAEPIPTEPLFWVDAKRGEGGFVHLDIKGLNAGERYEYAFVEVDFAGKPVGRSTVGRFRVAPHSNALVPISIGAACCTFNAFEPTILEHAGARKDLDFFMLLGDTTYNDGAVELHEFRDRWAQNLSKDGYLALRQSTSIIATLDDHEVENNFDPETTDPEQIRFAKQALFENQPIRRQEDAPDRIWRKFRWGRTLEVFVLDCRTERLPSTRDQDNAQYISPEQMHWLKEGLSQSDAVFKVIMNSAPISTFPIFFETDRWGGYPAQREEILNFIDHAKIPGVLWVSGDLHFASVGKISSEGAGSEQNEVLVGPGAQIPNYACLPLNLSSQFEWASARNNYVTFHFDPDSMDVELVYQGGSDDPRKTRRGDIAEIYRTTLHLGKR